MENLTIRPPNFKRFIAIGDGGKQIFEEITTIEGIMKILIESYLLIHKYLKIPQNKDEQMEIDKNENAKSRKFLERKVNKWRDTYLELTKLPNKKLIINQNNTKTFIFDNKIFIQSKEDFLKIEKNFLELWKHAIIKPEIIVGYNEAKIMPVKIREIEKETFLANLQLNIEYLQKWEKLVNELKKYKIETEKLIKNKVISNNEKESAKTKLEWSNKELENIEEIIFGIRENLTKIPNEKLKENYDGSKLISIKNLLENNNIAAINEQPLNSEKIIQMEVI
uniref:Uncharacterized protein n=1 Tax=Meloidogyne enterolobii TaxID=390850 RepID=A0A6V7VT50_MELEN|nr:unnamed protein product [Meloidogyne enterolobii]